MSNSNYSICLQRLKPARSHCVLWVCGLHNLAENWSWARDLNGQDRDERLVRLETETITLTTRTSFCFLFHQISLPSAAKHLNHWNLSKRVQYMPVSAAIRDRCIIIFMHVECRYLFSARNRMSNDWRVFWNESYSRRLHVTKSLDYYIIILLL